VVLARGIAQGGFGGGKFLGHSEILNGRQVQLTPRWIGAANGFALPILADGAEAAKVLGTARVRREWASAWRAADTAAEVSRLGA